MLVGDDIEGNEDDDGEENWGSVGEDVAEDVGAPTAEGARIRMTAL